MHLGSRFETRAKEGVLLEILEFGVHKISIKDDDELFCIVDSRRVSYKIHRCTLSIRRFSRGELGKL